MFHGIDVVAHFLRIGSSLLVRRSTGLEQQQLPNIGPRPFDFGALHRFQAKVRANQQVRIGEQPTDTPESVHSTGGLVEQYRQLLSELDLTGKGARMKRPESGRSRRTEPLAVDEKL